MTIVNIVAMIPNTAIPMAINDGVSVHWMYFMSIWKHPGNKKDNARTTCGE